MKPVAYVINLDRRNARWWSTMNLWSRWFTLVRFPAVDTPDDGARGCKQSHLQVAELALAEAPMAIIIEDDSVPTPKFELIFAACLWAASNHVDEWDWINISPYLDLTPIGMPKAVLSESFSRWLVRTTYAHNTNFCLYNRRSLPLLRSSLNSKLPVDVWLTRNATDQFVPVSLLATQSDVPSDIRKPFPQQHTFYDLSRRLLEATSKNNTTNKQ